MAGDEGAGGGGQHCNSYFFWNRPWISDLRGYSRYECAPPRCLCFWRENNHFSRGRGAFVHVCRALTPHHFVFCFRYLSRQVAVYYMDRNLIILPRTSHSDISCKIDIFMLDDLGMFDGWSMDCTSTGWLKDANCRFLHYPHNLTR